MTVKHTYLCDAHEPIESVCAIVAAKSFAWTKALKIHGINGRAKEVVMNKVNEKTFHVTAIIGMLNDARTKLTSYSSQSISFYMNIKN